MEMAMATRRAFTALLVCLTLSVSSPLQSSDEAGVWADEVLSLLEVEAGGDGDVAKAIEMVREDKNAAQHIEDSERAFKNAVPEKPEEQSKEPQPPPAEAQQAAPAAPEPTPQQASKQGNADSHDATWHCNHCETSCSTQKCKSWCQKSWCKQNSPLFTDTALKVPAKADNQWHCAHCKGVCKTNKCNSWCKKFWCPVDSDGSAYNGKYGSRYGKYGMRGKQGPKVTIHGGKGKMQLLELSKKGSPKLVAMERNANKIISLSNQDTTGDMLRAAANAIEGVMNQRELEEHQFKERETKSNEADQKRYSKKKYQKWKNEKDSAEGLNTEEEVSQAKERTQKDNANEIKFKTESDQGSEATKDLEKNINEENEKFEKKEKNKKETDAQINKDHNDMMAPDQEIFHMKNPAL